MKLGALLRKLRTQKKLSLWEVAGQIGVCQSMYFAWENDQSLPNAMYYEKLATVFGVTSKHLLSISTSSCSSPSRPDLDEYWSVSQRINQLQQRIKQLQLENQRLQEQLTQMNEAISGIIIYKGFREGNPFFGTG